MLCPTVCLLCVKERRGPSYCTMRCLSKWTIARNNTGTSAVYTLVCDSNHKWSQAVDNVRPRWSTVCVCYNWRDIINCFGACRQKQILLQSYQQNHKFTPLETSNWLLPTFSFYFPVQNSQHGFDRITFLFLKCVSSPIPFRPSCSRCHYIQTIKSTG